MKIAIIGSGNVATHLSVALVNAGHEVCGVYSRNADNALQLASKTGCRVYESPSQISDVDLALIAVKDDAIAEISSLISPGIPVAHTSGNTSMAILHGKRKGVFYPLQTFSKEKQLDLKTVPMCIEGSDSEILSVLNMLARGISEQVLEVNHDKRMFLHLAAVMVNNFPNHMYQMADSILKDQNLSFELLMPLIRETTDKLSVMSPQDAQTGPAKRGDVNTMNGHLAMLEHDPQLRKIYALISEHIVATYKNEQ